MSPATWPVIPGLPIPKAEPIPRAEESETGSAFGLLLGGWVPGDELGVADGMIAGNRLDALPAPMSECETLLRFGMGPSGSAVSGEELADDLVGAAGTAVMATVSAADGGVHFTEVTMLAVAVSFTEVIEVTPDATGICA